MNGTTGVQLKDQQSASQILHRILLDCARTYSNSLSAAGVPESPDTFRRNYVDIVPAFEAARLASAERTDIARHLSIACQQSLEFVTGDRAEPLTDYLQTPASPYPLQSVRGNQNADTHWQPAIEYGGKTWVGHDIIDLGAELAARGVVTAAAADALTWLAQNALDANGINLAARKIVVMGAAAEMASTEHFLQAGGDVLWIDQAPPPADWIMTDRFAGTLHWTEAPADLLAEPEKVLATIVAFADDQPVDVCLYAYAPGQARELRLTGTMNALVNALPKELIASVTMLVSPTTPAPLSPDDLQQMKQKRDTRAAWQGLFDTLGLFGQGGGTMNCGDQVTPRTVVSIQGASYQAAQYLAKVATADCWAHFGQPEAIAPTPLRVSANTAAITQTRSLEHPIFAAAFGGAAAFSIETFTPAQSRQVNGLLAIHDWLQPAPPRPGLIRVHGGIHTLPYPLESALKTAAAIGFAKSPKLIAGLLR